MISTNAWLMAAPNPNPRKGNIVVYSSCHTWSMIPYLLSREDVVAEYNITGVVVHLARDQKAYLDPRFAKIFSEADVILHHPLESDSWDGLRVKEFNLKSGCRLVTMESPQIGCVWPVLSGLGEHTVISCLQSGLTTNEIIAGFDDGYLIPGFESRFMRDKARMEKRDEGVDVKSSDFVFKYWQDVKMFSTCNHPSFHVYVWMMDQFVGLLGFPRRREEEALRVRDFAIDGDGHYPETEYEFQHYGFKYPMRYANGMGGRTFYHREIRTIYTRWKAGLTAPVDGRLTGVL